MFIAMNRFKVLIGAESQFEDVWRNRKSSLGEVDGFVDFKMLRGAENLDDGYRLYVSHSHWASQQAFSDWTKSDNFREAHRNAGGHKGLYAGSPQFEGFSVIEGI